MKHFPVAGPAYYRDDWHDARYTPTFHLHQGTDIFAAFDTPVRAPFEGKVTYGTEPVGGNAAYLRAADGTVFYMAHLNRFGPAPEGSDVRQGDIVGYVGDSGNARGGTPHLHLQIHPGGGAPVNPKPYLDAWLDEALAAAAALITSHRAATPSVPVEQRAASSESFVMARRATTALALGVHEEPAVTLVEAILSPLTPWQMRRVGPD